MSARGPHVCTRRRFLAQGVALGAAVGLGACGSSRSRTAIRVPGQLAALAQGLRGRLLVPDSAGYDAARLVYNARYDQVRPLAIVEAVGVEDVIRTIGFVQDKDVPLVLRSGGHSFAGYSTGRGSSSTSRG